MADCPSLLPSPRPPLPIRRAVPACSTTQGSRGLVSNGFLSQKALINNLQRHYTRALLPELYKVVGSASVFGDPVRLFHHLGLGVWSFLASPAAGGVGQAEQSRADNRQQLRA